MATSAEEGEELAGVEDVVAPPAPTAAPPEAGEDEGEVLAGGAGVDELGAEAADVEPAVVRDAVVGVEAVPRAGVDRELSVELWAALEAAGVLVAECEDVLLPPHPASARAHTSAQMLSLLGMATSLEGMADRV